MPRPRPKFLSYDDVRGIAESFLDDHWPQSSVPVDVERIADVGLGLNIIQFAKLEAEYRIDGFITADQTSIYVDQDTYNYQRPRARFTIAHELAHVVLHDVLLSNAWYKTPDEWWAWQNDMPSDDLKWFERQADWFAGLILVPSEHLHRLIHEGRTLARKKLGYPITLTEPEDRAYLCEWVGRRLEVSQQVVTIRCDREGCWEE